jgi:hypothetical protein
VDCYQLFAEQDVVAVILQGLAIGLSLHLVRAVQRRFERAELLNQFHRTLVTDSRRARDVVDRITT